MSASLLRSTPLTITSGAHASSRARWAGRILSGIVVLFLTFDTVVKLAGAGQAVQSTGQLGWPAHLLPTLAALEIVCLVLYLVPRTAPIGALLWTGYLGGAIATQLRLENPLFTYILFPTYVAALLWGGLYLRDARVRALLGARR